LDIALLLEDVDVFLDFLKERFSAESIDPVLESESHRYLQDPPAMQSLIVSHFQSMWDEVLSSEWERVAPVLRASVDAFRQLDLSGLSRLELVQRVLGRGFEKEKKDWRQALEQVERLIFVPSAHLGPYLCKFRSGNTLWLLFGARIPEGVRMYAPDLSRAEILVRVNGLADDVRLRILKFVSEEGEKRSNDIMDHVGRRQPAVSRHLKQLSATGYLDERRCEGAKCYTLNSRRSEDTLRAVSLFLLGK
jgi:DNA-binding transcriptional ArsR family regulator